MNQYTLEFPYPKNPEYVRSHSSNSISFYRTDQLAKMRHHTNKRHIPISLSPRDSSALFHRNTPTHNYDQISTGLVVNREIVEKSGLFVLTAPTYLAKNFTTLRQVRVRNSKYKFNKNPQNKQQSSPFHPQIHTRIKSFLFSFLQVDLYRAQIPK